MGAGLVGKQAEVVMVTNYCQLPLQVGGLRRESGRDFKLVKRDALLTCAEVSKASRFATAQGFNRGLKHHMR